MFEYLDIGNPQDNLDKILNSNISDLIDIDIFRLFNLVQQKNKHRGQTQLLSLLFLEKYQEYDIRLNFKDLTSFQLLKNLKKSQLVGQTFQIKGVIVEKSEKIFKPYILTYICQRCKSIAVQKIPESSDLFMPLNECQSYECKFNQIRCQLTEIKEEAKYKCEINLIIRQDSYESHKQSIPTEVQITLCGQAAETFDMQLFSYVKLQGVVIPSFTKPKLTLNSVSTVCNQIFKAFVIQNCNEITYKEIQCNLQGKQLFELLSQSLLPGMIGLDDLKKILLLQQLGGITNNENKFRKQIHVLILGNQSTGKSQILNCISKQSTKNIAVSATHMSEVGLFASVLKDSEQKTKLFPGPMLLASGGICSIDDYDKSSFKNTGLLHSALEDQLISINKQNLQAQIKLDTSLIITCSPREGQYNIQKTFGSNLPLCIDSALESRFDFKYVLNYTFEEEKQIVQKIGEKHCKLQNNSQFENLIPLDRLYDIIRYLKQQDTKITLDPDCNKIIREYYVKTRQQQISTSHGDYTTPRDILSVIRGGAALAKLYKDNLIRKSYIEEIIRLQETCKKTRLGEEHYNNEVKYHYKDQLDLYLQKALNNIGYNFQLIQDSKFGITQEFYNQVLVDLKKMKFLEPVINDAIFQYCYIKKEYQNKEIKEKNIKKIKKKQVLIKDQNNKNFSNNSTDNFDSSSSSSEDSDIPINTSLNKSIYNKKRKCNQIYPDQNYNLGDLNFKKSKKDKISKISQGQQKQNKKQEKIKQKKKFKFQLNLNEIEKSSESVNTSISSIKSQNEKNEKQKQYQKNYQDKQIKKQLQ